MNEDLLEIQPETAATAHSRLFPKMVGISLTVHLICAIFLAGGQNGRLGEPTINYLDLTMSEPAATAAKTAVPAPTMAVPVKSAEVPSTEPVPEPTPEPVPVPPRTEAEQLQDNLRNVVNSAASQPEGLQKVSFGLGLMSGHFGTIADGKSLRDDMREYHLSLLKAVNEKWWQSGSRPEGVGNAIVIVYVARNGEIVNAQIMQSSGNPSYDRTMLRSLRDTSPVPPLPAHFEQSIYSAPIRFNAPLTLFGAPTG